MEDDIVPVLTLHPSCGFTVNETFECPLDTESSCTLATIYHSAMSGCPCCILHYTAIKSIAPELSDSAEFEGTHDYIFLPFRVQRQRFVLAWDDNDDGQTFKKPPFDEDDTGQDCDFYGDRLGGIELVERVVPCDTSSSKTLATVQKWIQKCDEGHGCMCESSMKLPRRVLDVRDNRIKLRETTAADQGSKYACLSHCWGTPSTEITRVCTTPATLESYYEDIPFEILPPTFQDAVSFTRRLDIPFLWIDSFCIIQCEPDKKDWHEQSGNMANIYRNAYVTLAAAISTNPRGGCYTREDKPRLHHTGKPIAVMQYSDGTKHNVFARRRFVHDAYSLPLLKRGWVYQERILSPRMVYFVGEELVWECNETIDCECGGDGLEDQFERIRVSDIGEDRVVGPSHQHPKPMRLWYQIVHDYTALALSRSSDALPGLSGIAKVFAARIGDDYVAGMWRRTLVSNLLWYLMEEEEEEGGKRVDPKAQSLTAPSWSWASRPRTAAKAHFLPVTKVLAEVKDVVCHAAGADPTGELETEAHLTLSTTATSASLEYLTTKPDLGYLIHLGSNFTISKTPASHSWGIWDLETGYFDLDKSQLPRNHGSLDLLLAQIASCIQNEQLHLSGHDTCFPFQQEVRSYMLLARRPCDDNNERWIRIGLATIAAYNYNLSLYGANAKEMDRKEKAEKVRHMTREEVEAALEGEADRNRAMFRQFDESEVRDITVW
jgi:hypothetical protein